MHTDIITEFLNKKIVKIIILTLEKLDEFENLI